MQDVRCQPKEPRWLIAAIGISRGAVADLLPTAIRFFRHLTRNKVRVAVDTVTKSLGALFARIDNSCAKILFQAATSCPC